MHKNQAGFSPCWGCINQICTLRQILRYSHMFRRSTISFFLDLKTVFDLVDRASHWRVGHSNSLHSFNMYMNSQSWARVYDYLSLEMSTRIDVHRAFSLSASRFNPIIEIILEIDPSPCENSGINFCWDWNLSDVEYAHDVLLITEDSSNLQVFLNCLSNFVVTFGTRFASPKCEMLSHDWISSRPNLVVTEEERHEMDRFSWLGSCSSHGWNAFAHAESSFGVC